MAGSGSRKDARRLRKRGRPVRVALLESATGIPPEIEEALNQHPGITVVRRASSIREALGEGSTPDVVVAEGRLLSALGFTTDLAEPLGLSPREREVLALVAEGRTSREIASILRVTLRTVESHREHIGRKLGTRTVAGFTRLAIAHGLVDDD
jgi:DNA-binding NarL/FixJ family response regulator